MSYVTAWELLSTDVALVHSHVIMLDQVLFKMVFQLEGLAAFIALEAILGVSIMYVHLQSTDRGERLGAVITLVRPLITVMYRVVVKQLELLRELSASVWNKFRTAILPLHVVSAATSYS